MQKPLRFPPRERGINPWLAPLPSPPPPHGQTRAPCAPQSPPPAARPEAGGSRGRAEARGAARHGRAALPAATPTCLLVVIAHHNEVIGQPGHGYAGHASASPPQRLQRRLGAGSASSAPRPPQKERHHLSHVGDAGALCACAPPGPLAVTSGLGGGWGGRAWLSRSAAAPGRVPCRYAAASATISLRSPPQVGKARRGRSAPRTPEALSPGCTLLCGGRPGGGQRVRDTFSLQKKLAASPSALHARGDSDAAAGRCRGRHHPRRGSAEVEAGGEIAPAPPAWPGESGMSRFVRGVRDVPPRGKPSRGPAGLCGGAECAGSRPRTPHISIHAPERAVLSGPAWPGPARPCSSP